MDAADLSNRFAYHKPPDEATANLHSVVRGECLRVAAWLNDVLPEGREKSLAITHLEETMMWANAAIARNPH